MKLEFRRELAQLPFEEEIRKAGELIRFSRKIKRYGSNDSENAAFNSVELSGICSRPRLEFTRRGCGAVKPVAALLCRGVPL